MVQVTTMSVDQWIGVPDNPRQRDTERRARNAKHLRRFKPTHAQVAMAVLPDGRWVKLDGHTRAWLWQRGEVTPPGALLVALYPVASLAEAAEMYTLFDAAEAVESKADQVFGGLREQNLSPQSKLVASGRVAAALRFAEIIRVGVRGRQSAEYGPVYPLIAEWRNELEQLDRLNPSFKIFPSGVQAAFLLSERKYGADVDGFWRAYVNDEGTKTLEGRDGPQALRAEVERQRSLRTMGGRANRADLCARAVNAVEVWREGRRLQRGLQQFRNLDTYLGAPIRNVGGRPARRAAEAAPIAAE